MLVLSRRQGQSIKIGDAVTVKIVEIRGKGQTAVVKIGIEAPHGTKILREEVILEVAREMALAKDPELNLDDLASKLRPQPSDK